MVINFFMPGEDEPVEVQWPTGWPIPNVNDQLDLDAHDVHGKVREVCWANEKPAPGQFGIMWSIDITLR